MLSLSPSGREQAFRAGIVCLIFGAGMLVGHLIRLSMSPTPVVVYNPTPATALHSDPNPAWALPQRHKKKVAKDMASPVPSASPAPSDQKSAPPPIERPRQAAPPPMARYETAPPPQERWAPNLAQPTRLELNGKSSITLPHSLLEVQVERIEVSGAGTRVSFRVTGSGVRGSQVCIEGPSSRGANRKNFLIDGQGRLYKYLSESGLQDCSELARGEVRYFAIVYELLSLPTKTVLVSWSNPYSPSLNILVLVRQY